MVRPASSFEKQDFDVFCTLVGCDLLALVRSRILMCFAHWRVETQRYNVLYLRIAQLCTVFFFCRVQTFANPTIVAWNNLSSSFLARKAPRLGVSSSERPHFCKESL